MYVLHLVFLKTSKLEVNEQQTLDLMMRVTHVMLVNILAVIVCLIDLWSSVIHIHSCSTRGIVSVGFEAKAQLKESCFQSYLMVFSTQM